MQHLPELRVRVLNDRAIERAGDYVLYWMVATRRPRWNFALDRALAHAHDLGRPLLVFEALRCDYRWASARHHSFVLDGMRANQAAFEGSPVRYLPFVETAEREGAGLLARLAARACAVVTDDSPVFFIPRMLGSAAGALGVRVEAVDSNGLLPLATTVSESPTAHSFRRFLQRELPQHLSQTPDPRPLEGLRLPELADLPRGVQQDKVTAEQLLALPASELLSSLPIDQAVAPCALRGGHAEARERLDIFLEARLAGFGDRRRCAATEEATSGLSPYLHFGQISPHEILHTLAELEGWSPEDVDTDQRSGAREGWWNMSAAAESFLDQLVTWRELGHVFAHHRQADQHSFSSLPDWARKTLSAHADDPRDPEYSLEQLRSARTHDELWNATQRQLLREGRIHGYLRMLWGKKILEWSPSPRAALSRMLELNNRYALDGRDPNSTSGIFWTLGRFDRAWGPERPIYGHVRYMTSENTRRKLDLRRYLELYGAGEAPVSHAGPGAPPR